MIRRPPISTRTDTLLPYPTLFRSGWRRAQAAGYSTFSGGRLRHQGPRRRAYDGLGPSRSLKLAKGRPKRRNARIIAQVIVCAATISFSRERSREERRVGKGCVGTWRYRWWADN